MKKDFQNYFPLAQAISILLHPYGEVVVHDLRTGCIVGIFNNLSKRKVGDESLLEEIKGLSQLPDVFPLYFKTNWDGRKMKSVSVTLRDHQGKPMGMLCINVDLTKWEELHRFALDFIQGWGGMEQPAVLFKNDWREKINVFVNEYLKKERATLKTLSKEKTQKLVIELHREGAFGAKNAASYVADVMGISRATIYNYLRKK